MERVKTISSYVNEIVNSPMGGVNISDLGLQYCDELLQGIRDELEAAKLSPADLPIFDYKLYELELGYSDELVARVNSWAPAKSEDYNGKWAILPSYYPIVHHIRLINVILNTASE